MTKARQTVAPKALKRTPTRRETMRRDQDERDAVALARSTLTQMPLTEAQRRRVEHLRLDGWISALTAVGTARDKRQHAHFVAPHLNWRENMDLWRGNALAGRIVELMPEEMMREGWELCVEQPDGPKIVKRVVSLLEDLGFDDHLLRGLCLENAVGGSGIVLGVEDLSGDMAEPLSLGSVSQLKWMETFEPIELQVSTWQNDPQLPRFGRPERYRLMPVSPGGVKRGTGVEIHASRILVFPGIVVSRRQITAQMGWGDARLTRCRETIRDFQNSYGAIGHLVTEYGLPVWKIKGLAEIIAMDKDKELKTRVEMMQLAMSMVNAVLLDAELEDYDRKQVSLTGLSDVLRDFRSQLAADAGVPETLLFGMSPGGMNATGEFDSRSWYDRTRANQKSKLRKPIETAVKIAFRALKIQEPQSWYIKFRPLLTQSEQEQAQARMTQMQVDQGYSQMGVLTKDEIRAQRFGGREFSFSTHVEGPAPKSEPAPADEPSSDDKGQGSAGGGFHGGFRRSSRYRVDGATVEVSGLQVVVETPVGGVRHWVDLDGRSGRTTMLCDYGYILSTRGADGEAVDAFVGPERQAPVAFVVRQMRAPDFDEYDEDKVMLGFPTMDDARRTYLRHYDDPRYLGSIRPVPVGELAKMVGQAPVDDA